MAYHDDLLRQAIRLVHNEPKNPKQASLRRAVSTAYYALFHLLISEAVVNWSRVSQRGALGRAFEHGTMKTASNRIQNREKFPYLGKSPQVIENLRTVANTFSHLQERRHIADYDNSTVWTRTEALTEVRSAEHAFAIWKTIREEEVAQAYLVSLIVKKRD